MSKATENHSLTVFEYHERTKHHLHRYARSLGYMDWSNEPNPFRSYEGANRIRLPLIEKDTERPYETLYGARDETAESVTLPRVAALLELSLGLSAWKQYGASRWSLRMNPSSGNLHPTECYLLLPAMDQKPACIAHYNPFRHCLEVRAELERPSVAELSEISGFGVILTSIYWREAWKYGERAFRYCHHDLGHALAALAFSANLMGWSFVLQPGIGDRELDRFLGFDRIQWPESEEEHADCLCWISPETPSCDAVKEHLQSWRRPVLAGAPNQLSENHVNWDVIDSVSSATLSPGTRAERGDVEPPPWRYSLTSSLSAQAIIRRRRSAQAYDLRESKTDRPTFLGMLERTLPSRRTPFGGFPFEPRVHLALFVHHVAGLESGLYLLVRNSHHEAELRSSLDSSFSWEPVDDGFPLYLLQPGDFREQAMTISCHQEIAGASAFSMGMLTRFQPLVEDTPWVYPRLFWETGIVGQVLYLEAEAHGLRSTGIGCFFDDEMHRLLGLKGNTYQSLYHFTVGYALTDDRVETLAPYEHLREAD